MRICIESVKESRFSSKDPRYIWVKYKDFQWQGQGNHAFCLGGVVCIKLFENGSPIKLYHMNDIPDFPSESSIEN